MRSEVVTIFGSKQFITFLNVGMFNTGSSLSQVGGNFTFTLFPIFVHRTLGNLLLSTPNRQHDYANTGGIGKEQILMWDFYYKPS